MAADNGAQRDQLTEAAEHVDGLAEAEDDPENKAFYERVASDIRDDIGTTPRT